LRGSRRRLRTIDPKPAVEQASACWF
jgi:hypothetical protein